MLKTSVSDVLVAQFSLFFSFSSYLLSLNSLTKPFYLFIVNPISTNTKISPIPGLCSYHTIPPEDDSNPTRVNTSLGVIKGFVPKSGPDSFHRHFRGIRYAKAPVADLRWRPPQPVDPWLPAEYDATSFGSSCPQFGPNWASMQLNNTFANGTYNFNEDCLFLNVYAPTAKPPPEGFPTMVYLPAGQLEWGSSNDLENYKAPPIPAARDVIFVTGNYRLGPLGWLALDILRPRDPSNSTGNYGAQDQRAILKWIHDHIAAFGGDPQKVTLWGESAGASSVTALLSMESTWGYYNNAIIESGSFNLWSYKGWKQAVANGMHLLQNLGCPQDGEDVIPCLLNASVLQLLNMSDDGRGAANRYPYTLPYSNTMDKCTFGPAIDGVELKAPPPTLIQHGKIAPNVTIIMGTNRDEGSTFTFYQNGYGDSVFTNESEYDRWVYEGNSKYGNKYAVNNETQFRAWATSVFGAKIASNLTELYRPNGTVHGIPTWWWSVSHVIGDYLLSCPANKAAKTTANPKFPHLKNSYLYYFNHTPTVSVNQGETYSVGAFHGSEVPFVFYDDFELVTPDERNLSQAMVTYWTNLAWTGNPNKPGKHRATKIPSLPQWPLYKGSPESSIAIVFGDLPNPGIQDGIMPLSRNISFVSNLKKDLCAFWDTGGFPL
eukprot:UC4_evm1s682